MTAVDNLSALIHGPKDVRLSQLPVPVPKPDEVLVKVHAVGICGTDIHFYTHAAFGSTVIKEPYLFGHECTGTVTEVGSEVKNFQVGDRVVMEPNVPCTKCEYCLQGRDNLCTDIRLIGAFTRVMAWPAFACIKLPESISLEEGAILEPLTCAFHGCRRAGLHGGETVLICGSGAIGALSLLCARALGVHRVVATDIADSRLKTIKELGADYTVNVTGKSPKEAAEAIRQATGGVEPDVVLECTGFPVSIETAIWAVKPAGTVAIVGMGADRGELPIMAATQKEITLMPSLKYLSKPEFPTVVKMVANHQIDLRKVSTAHYKLEEIELALKKTMAAEVVKVLVHCHE